MESKYKRGEFGYYWTSVLGKTDIKGTVYDDHIECMAQNLTSLRGCPKIINGRFICISNKLISLEYCPEIINDKFWCYNNKIKDIKEFRRIKYIKDIRSDFDDYEVIELIKDFNPEYYC